MAMMPSVQSRMSESAQAFREIVWPRLAPSLDGGDLIPVETVTDSRFASLLDMQAGIDAWQVVGSGGIRGVASRVQWGPTSWRTWTVRTHRTNGTRTEIDKLIDADPTLLRPSLHVQAYVLGHRLLTAGCIKTRDLTFMLLSGDHDGERTNPADGSRFVVIHWDRARALGYPVWEVGP